MWTLFMWCTSKFHASSSCLSLNYFLCIFMPKLALSTMASSLWFKGFWGMYNVSKGRLFMTNMLSNGSHTRAMCALKRINVGTEASSGKEIVLFPTMLEGVDLIFWTACLWCSVMSFTLKYFCSFIFRIKRLSLYVVELLK